MADEILGQVRLTANKDGASLDFNESGNLDMSGSDMEKFTQLIDTSATTINFGVITTPPGMIAVKNLDDTNYVEIAAATDMSGLCLRIKAGMVQLISPTNATIFGKANTAAVRLMFGATKA